MLRFGDHALEAIVLTADRHRDDVELLHALAASSTGWLSPMHSQPSCIASRTVAAKVSGITVPPGSLTLGPDAR
jgi:hypothetical protein